MLVVLLAAFSLPFKLIDSNFACFGFEWLKNTDVWLFSASTWLSLFFVYFFISRLSNVPKGYRLESLGNPYVIVPLFSLSLTTFFTIYFSYSSESNYLIMALMADIVLLGILFLTFKHSDNKTRNIVLTISACFMILPFVYKANFAEKFSISPITEEATNNEVWKIKSVRGANLRENPSKTADIIVTVPNSSAVEFLNDSSFYRKQLWYKIKYKNSEGWIRKSLLTK